MGTKSENHPKPSTLGYIRAVSGYLHKNFTNEEQQNIVPLLNNSMAVIRDLSRQRVMDYHIPSVYMDWREDTCLLNTQHYGKYQNR